MLAPKRVKFRKMQKGRMRGVSQKGCDVSYGDFALQSLDACWVTSKQIEAGRVAISRHVKRQGRLWIRIFPDKPISKKPAETRMGKGKGNPEEWVAVVKRGRVIFEIQGVPEPMAREAFRLASHKLPVKTRFLTRGAEL
ncbi:MAG: 50S ribosomal protein L16 [Deltaproteobacteria bacterium]|nr:50S ribosomal protein L16 [Deltaproteobacteria bacterium]